MLEGGLQQAFLVGGEAGSHSAENSVEDFGRAVRISKGSNVDTCVNDILVLAEYPGGLTSLATWVDQVLDLPIHELGHWLLLARVVVNLATFQYLAKVLVECLPVFFAERFESLTYASHVWLRAF